METQIEREFTSRNATRHTENNQPLRHPRPQGPISQNRFTSQLGVCNCLFFCTKMNFFLAKHTTFLFASCHFQRANRTRPLSRWSPGTGRTGPVRGDPSGVCVRGNPSGGLWEGTRQGDCGRGPVRGHERGPVRGAVRGDPSGGP